MTELSPDIQDFITQASQSLDVDTSARLEGPQLMEEAFSLVHELREALLTTPDTRDEMARTFFNPENSYNRITIVRGRDEYRIDYETYKDFMGQMDDGGVSHGNTLPQSFAGSLSAEIQKKNLDDPSRIEAGYIKIAQSKIQMMDRDRLGQTQIKGYVWNKNGEGTQFEGEAENSQLAAERIRKLISEIKQTPESI